MIVCINPRAEDYDENSVSIDFVNLFCYRFLNLYLII